jgi:hypothetical protein
MHVLRINQIKESDFYLQRYKHIKVNVLFLDIIIFYNEIISYSNCAYNKVFTVKFLL